MAPSAHGRPNILFIQVDQLTASFLSTYGNRVAKTPHLDEFAANFGESYVLDSSRSSWSVLLWVVPIVGLVVGGGVILWMRRSSDRSEEVAA